MLQGYYHASLKEMARHLHMTPNNAGYSMITICFCQVMVGKISPVLEYCDLLEKAFSDNPEFEGLLATGSALRSLCHLKTGEPE